MNLKNNQTIGRYQLIHASVMGRDKNSNQDAVCIREVTIEGETEPGCLIAVMDGVTKCSYGGAVARWISASLSDWKVVVKPAAIERQLTDWLNETHARYMDELGHNEDWRTSAATLTLAVLFNGRYAGFWMGDSPVYVARTDGTQRKTEVLTRPHQDTMRRLTRIFTGEMTPDPEFFSGDFTPGTTITLASDGFAAIWDSGSLAEQLKPWTESGLNPVEHLMEMPFRDDATFVAVKCGKNQRDMV
jgi:serine/threonine protein phosphatase PrpC